MVLHFALFMLMLIAASTKDYQGKPRNNRYRLGCTGVPRILINKTEFEIIYLNVILPSSQ